MTKEEALKQKLFECLCNRITELEEENEKLRRRKDYWKDSANSWRDSCFSRTPVKVAAEEQKQFREAKEIIDSFLDFEAVVMATERGLYMVDDDTYERAEKFLK